jgi:hypothetical protein
LPGHTADADVEHDILIANTSDTPGRAAVTFTDGFDGESATRTFDLPAQRVLLVHMEFGFASFEVSSQATNGNSPPPIVVERASYVTVDGISHAREVSIVGNVK